MNVMITTKNFFCALLFSSLMLTSCKKELEPQEDSETPIAVVSEAENPMNVTTTAPDDNTTATSPNAAPTPQPTKVAPGMNPAHGQPNHRCDIEVGAPLNSPVKQASPQPVATPAMNVSTAPAPKPVNSEPVITAPGMNPPHGQEGHLCEIAVGAPLPK